MSHSVSCFAVARPAVLPSSWDTSTALSCTIVPSVLIHTRVLSWTSALMDRASCCCLSICSGLLDWLLCWRLPLRSHVQLLLYRVSCTSAESHIALRHICTDGLCLMLPSARPATLAPWSETSTALSCTAASTATQPTRSHPPASSGCCTSAHPCRSLRSRSGTGQGPLPLQAHRASARGADLIQPFPVTSTLHCYCCCSCG